MTLVVPSGLAILGGIPWDILWNFKETTEPGNIFASTKPFPKKSHISDRQAAHRQHQNDRCNNDKLSSVHADR